MNEEEKPSIFYFNFVDNIYDKCYESCPLCIYGGNKNENNCSAFLQINSLYYYFLLNLIIYFPNQLLSSSHWITEVKSLITSFDIKIIPQKL